MLSDCKHPASQIDCEIDAVSGESYYWCESCGREIDGCEYDVKCAEELGTTSVIENESQRLDDIGSNTHEHAQPGHTQARKVFEQ